MKISIAKDFSDVPIGRARSDGDYTGEAFREDYLIPQLRKATANDPLIVELDGAEGYPSSFLEEAFGGLVRHHKEYSADELRRLLKIEAGAGYRTYRNIIWDYIKDADSRA